MSCPICDHTMEKVSSDGLWWCPRCGTLSGSHLRTVPKLVQRTTNMLDFIAGHTHKMDPVLLLRHGWMLGLPECVTQPGPRRAKFQP